MEIVYILLGIIIVLIVVVAVMVKTSQAGRDNINEALKKESSRLESVLRDENKNSDWRVGKCFRVFLVR